jgi:hypothetical protein
MPLTNEDIISSLVAYYKRTGVDMTSLLGDPTFQSMKVKDKIGAIKIYARDIHDGSTDALTSPEKKSISYTAIANAWPIIPAIATLALQGPITGLLPGVKSKTLIGLGIGGAALGLAVGGMKGYIQARQARDYREGLRRNLANVVQNPTTTNAIGVLSLGNIRNNQFSFGSALGNTASGELDKYNPGEFIAEKYSPQLEAMNKYEQAAKELRDSMSNRSN